MENSAVLTEVLRDFLWNRIISDDCFDIVMTDPGRFFEFAGIHNVRGIAAYKVYEYAMRFPEDDELAAIAKVAEVYYNKTAEMYGKRAEKYKRLAEILCENNIDFIPFKGILVKDYYTIPQLRTFGDIDIIIRECDRKKCHKLMLDNGYIPDVDFGSVYTYKKDSEFYEIHTDIMVVNFSEHADYKQYFKRMWDYAEVYSKNEYRLTPEFHFIYLIAHIAKHIYCRGAGIRMYFDIAFIFKEKSDIDWKAVLDELKRIKLDRLFYIITDAVEKWFGVTVSYNIPKIEQGVTDSFMRFTMDSGIFGESGVSDAQAKMLKVKTDDNKNPKLKAAVRILFPPREQIESRYTYLKKYPFLLPVAWVHRTFLNLSKLKEKLKQTADVLSSDEDIGELSAFLKNIGL